MKNLLIPGLFLIVGTISCEKDANNVKLPEFEQKLVVNSFISPRDTLSIISVTSNKKLYGLINQHESLGQVTAVLNDGSNEINLEKIENGFIFRKSDILLEEGKTYKLTVISSKGLKATASSTIPFRRPVKIEVDTLSKFFDYGDGSGNGWKEYKAEIYLTDYPGEVNYYRFAAKEVIYNSNYTYYPYHYDVYPEEPVIFNDNGRDGKRFLINTVNFDNASEDDSAHLVVYVLLTDKAYYTYHYSMDRYAGGGDPFTEISPAYSNISGGLGIFASYVVDSVVFRLR